MNKSIFKTINFIVIILIFSISAIAGEDCFDGSLEPQMQLIQAKQECLDLFLKGKKTKIGKYFEEGDKNENLQLSLFLKEFLERFSIIKGSKLNSVSLPKLLAFGENHQAIKGIKKRGKLFTLMALQSCLEGRSLNIMYEGFGPEKVKMANSTLKEKRNYLKQYFYMDLVDQMPDSFLNNLHISNWEEPESSEYKQNLLTNITTINSQVEKLVELGKSPQNDHEWINLSHSYKKILEQLRQFTAQLDYFIYQFDGMRNHSLVKNSINEMKLNPLQTLVIVAGESHLNYSNRSLIQLLNKEDVSVIKLHSMDEIGLIKTKTKTKGLWSILADIEDHLDLLRAKIQLKFGSQLPSFPKSLSYKIK